MARFVVCGARQLPVFENANTGYLATEEVHVPASFRLMGPWAA
jgi:hypothetical protein